MHELGIVFHVIDSVEAIAKENQIDEVASVTLELGEVSGVVGEYLSDCWKWAITRTEYLKNSELKATRRITSVNKHTQKCFREMQYEDDIFFK